MPNSSAMSAPMAIPPVATPAIASGFPYLSTIASVAIFRMVVLISGKLNILLLSQYIGERLPLAHVKGCEGDS
jgi:hypothetical protein